MWTTLMHRLLERKIASIADHLVVLAPPAGEVPWAFNHRSADVAVHRSLLRDMQRLRGRVYLDDGAIRPDQLSTDGRHQTPEDDRSWHLLMLDDKGAVAACLWYLEHRDPASIDDLRVKSCPLVTSDQWRETIRGAIASEIGRARSEEIAYAEVGGWAAVKQDSCSPEGLLLILATFGFSRLLGGALGVTTATERHSSAAILRRLGLSYLSVAGSTVPAYYDPRYQCQMELLRFDTRQANPRYERLVELLMDRLVDVPVVAPSAPDLVVPHAVVADAPVRIPASHRLLAGAAA
jgi:hypothetical protein